MSRLSCQGLLCASLVLATILSARGLHAADGKPSRPHIVYLLADDLGWADVGYHAQARGGRTDETIKTPNLDRLAAQGTKLEQFYVQSLCTPTRTALMTGKYPFRLGLHVGVVRPWAQYGVPLEERLLPQALSEAGYETAIVGKWHLGHFEPAYLPTRRGFLHQYGHYNGAIDYLTHERDGGLDWHRNDKALREEGYSTHLLADEAVRRIADRDVAKRLFLYVPFNAVHAPHQVPAAYTQPYQSLAKPRRTYAGMVAALDEAVGRIVEQLTRSGILDETLLIFHSDNGGPNPGVVTDNGDLRGAKGSLYEGGVRVPAFAVWPNNIPAGATIEQPLHVVDWYPTLVKLAGARDPDLASRDGKDIWDVLTAKQPSPHSEIVLNATPTAGAIRVGDWKLIVNGNREHNDGRDPVTGRLVTFNQSSKEDDSDATEQVELFDLRSDPRESRNLAAEHPERVRSLRARLTEFAKQAATPRVSPRPEGFKVPAVWGEP